MTVEVYNQTGLTSSWSLVGSTRSQSTIRVPPRESAPSLPIRLIWLRHRQASRLPEAVLPTLGFGLPVVNFIRNGTCIAQARATSGNSTTLTVPFPTTQGVFGGL